MHHENAVEEVCWANVQNAAGGTDAVGTVKMYIEVDAGSTPPLTSVSSSSDAARAHHLLGSAISKEWSYRPLNSPMRMHLTKNLILREMDRTSSASSGLRFQ
jgi:hypothetical protein